MVSTSTKTRITLQQPTHGSLDRHARTTAKVQSTNSSHPWRYWTICVSVAAVLRPPRLCGACHLELLPETNCWKTPRKRNKKKTKAGLTLSAEGRTCQVRRLHHLPRARTDGGRTWSHRNEKVGELYVRFSYDFILWADPEVVA
jgi:hypothetical protein